MKNGQIFSKTLWGTDEIFCYFPFALAFIYKFGF
jgi:hypothetical protein